MSYCDPEQPCESCGRTQADIDKRKQRELAANAAKKKLLPKWKRRKS